MFDGIFTVNSHAQYLIIYLENSTNIHSTSLFASNEVNQFSCHLRIVFIPLEICQAHKVKLLNAATTALLMPFHSESARQHSTLNLTKISHQNTDGMPLLKRTRKNRAKSEKGKRENERVTKGKTSFPLMRASIRKSLMSFLANI